MRALAVVALLALSGCATVSGDAGTIRAICPRARSTPATTCRRRPPRLASGGEGSPNLPGHARPEGHPALVAGPGRQRRGKGPRLLCLRPWLHADPREQSQAGGHDDAHEPGRPLGGGGAEDQVHAAQALSFWKCAHLHQARLWLPLLARLSVRSRHLGLDGGPAAGRGRPGSRQPHPGSRSRVWRKPGDLRGAQRQFRRRRQA